MPQTPDGYFFCVVPEKTMPYIDKSYYAVRSGAGFMVYEQNRRADGGWVAGREKYFDSMEEIELVMPESFERENGGSYSGVICYWRRKK